MTSHAVIIPMLVALVAATGCGSSRGTTTTGGAGLDRVAIERQSSPVYESLHPTFDVFPNGDGTYSFIFSAGASGTSDAPTMRLLRGIVEVSFTVHDGSGAMIDSLGTTDIPTSGIAGADGAASLTATGRVAWRPRSALTPPMQVVMRASGAEGVIVRIAELPMTSRGEIAPSSAERLALTLTSEERAGRLDFVLEVERVGPGAPDEYMPSGEQFRIEIFGDAGERVWSSSAGQMFTQALGPVLPARVGERVSYRASFDGRNDVTHESLAPGRYSIVATIPAKPSPYVLREELTWAGR